MIREAAQAALAAQANPEKADGMQRYMKTDMPFYGVQTPARRVIARDLVRRFPAVDVATWQANILELWGGPSREEKHLALDYTGSAKAFIRPAQLPLFERLIREGAWWDFVDWVATKFVGGALAHDPDAVLPVLDRWIDDPDMWIRRTAIIGQLKRKADTDFDRLSRYILARAHETEFFIRKAIGWSLREYAKTNPSAVTVFILTHREALSGLSFREASKHLNPS